MGGVLSGIALEAFVDVGVWVIFAICNKVACAIARAAIAIGTAIAFGFALTSIIGGGGVAERKKEHAN